MFLFSLFKQYLSPDIFNQRLLFLSIKSLVTRDYSGNLRSLSSLSVAFAELISIYSAGP
jgi:hypothetical protein